mgnify:CR=1 FL=1
MNIRLSASFLRAYKKVIRKRPQLATKIKNKMRLLRKDPAHISLRLHKLTGSKRDTWSISVEEDLRIIFYRINNSAVLVDIGKHEEVY